MKTFFLKMSACVVVLLFGCAVPLTVHAGQTLKWEQVPKAVRDTVLAHGGVAGQSVDKEPKSANVNGKTLYEAPVKDKDGKVVDLQITEDGKFIEAKTDDAADAAAEKADRAKAILAGVKFSHPREINHPYLPLASLKQDILEGTEGGKKTRVERTLLPKKRRTFTIGDQEVESLVMEDRVFVNGELEEIALDYFAQDDNGTVYYLGEDVDEYENGKIKNHEGAWLLGKDTPIPGVILPAHLKVGLKFKPEDVSKEIMEDDEVISLSETVTVPAGTFHNCVKIKELLGDGSTEYKYYARGIGAVRESPADGDELLISHNKPVPTGSAASASAKTSEAPSEAEARVALKKVGVDPEAEAVWLRAINDPKLSAETRSGLIEDLNEVGFANPSRPTKAELPLIKKRLDIIKRLRPEANGSNAAALDEARKDLEAMAASLASK